MKLLRTLVLLSFGCTVPHEGLQPGPEGPCATAADCDDEVECTHDACESGVCVSTPDNSLCPDAGQVCSPILQRCADSDECVPEQCATERRLVGTCQVGVCVEEDCTLGPVNSGCSAGEFCCGNGSCAPCDDGSPCTTDACDLTAAGCDPENPDAACCSHTPFDGDCDDGSFCNGSETCVAGTCAAGEEPCEADATCMEAIDRCDSCVTDAGCPDAPGAWSPCTQNGGAFCNNTGTRTRTVETSRCEEGACVPAEPRVETDSSCAFDPTTLGPCMAATMPAFGACTFGATPCAGTQSRVVTSFACTMDGACVGTGSMETRGCNASMGTTCATTTMTAFGACGGFSPADCGVTGTQTRTITTYACNGSGSCNSTPMPDSQPCTRATRDGMMCGPPITGSSCVAGGANPCTGRRVVGSMCAGGTCSADRTMPCNMPDATMCGADSVETSCEADGVSCTTGDEIGTTVRRQCNASGMCEERRASPAPTGETCALTADQADGETCDDMDMCTVMDRCSGNTCGGDAKCEGMCLNGEGMPMCMDGESCQCDGSDGSCDCG